MKLLSKASLASALVFPGLGQLLQKEYSKAAIFSLLSLFSLSVIVKVTFQKAQEIVQQLNLNGGAIDPVQLMKLIEEIPVDASTTYLTIASYSLLICWAASIFEAIRSGDKKVKE